MWYFQNLHEIIGTKCKHGGKESKLLIPLMYLRPFLTHFFDDTLNAIYFIKQIMSKTGYIWKPNPQFSHYGWPSRTWKHGRSTDQCSVQYGGVESYLSKKSILPLLRIALQNLPVILARNGTLIKVSLRGHFPN